MNHYGKNYDYGNHNCHDQPGWPEGTTSLLGVMPIALRVGIDDPDGRLPLLRGVPLVG
jgi:hypothetical protein